MGHTDLAGAALGSRLHRELAEGDVMLIEDIDVLAIPVAAMLLL